MQESIKIKDKEFKEIIIKDQDDTVIAMITDDGKIIEHDGYKVLCVPLEKN